MTYYEQVTEDVYKRQALGTIYYYILGQHGAPGYTSLPVIFGTVGGIGLILGPIGLLVLLKRRNRQIDDESQTGMDLSFILLLLLIAITGLLLLVLRQSSAMGTLLIVHLGLVMTLFPVSYTHLDVYKRQHFT